MKLSLISASIAAYVLLAVAWICDTQLPLHFPISVGAPF